MNTLRFSFLGIALVLFVALSLLSTSDRSVQAFDDCCSPPRLPAAAARFQPGASVTVYLDTRGLTATEIAAIKSGLEDWNDESNNSGVTYHVVETQDPPAAGENNTVVARFVDLPGSAEAAIVMFDQRDGNGNVIKVWATLTYWNRIRSGTPSLLPAFIRATSRHEGGHGLGLANSDTNGCPEGSNIMFPSRNQETFITPCDNAKINGDPVYSPTATPTPTPEPTPTPCAEEGHVCGFDEDCCPGCVCGEVTHLCFPCEVDPNYPQGGCMTETCYSCYQGEGTFCDPWSNSCYTPLIVDIDGDGFQLTNLNDGVRYDAFGHGRTIQSAWTKFDSDDAWLVLDRNGNGQIDDGTEMFSSVAPQPVPTSPTLKNGFNALVQHDRLENGGNADGVLNRGDAVFSSLRLWQDTNHNGLGEAWELHTLPELGLTSIDMDYREAKRSDSHGNKFKFRAKVKDKQGAQLGRWIYDVYLLARP